MNSPLLSLLKSSRAATRWSTIDQEAYGIVFAIKELKAYPRGHKFVVQTDHKNLTSIREV
jgi:hypothetical protein